MPQKPKVDVLLRAECEQILLLHFRLNFYTFEMNPGDDTVTPLKFC